MKKIKGGFFITVEGIDGSGKSSVVNFLSSELTKLGFLVIKTKEPGGTTLGISLRNILQECSGAIDPKAEFLLFAADRAEHMKCLIKPNLENGAIIISDRGPDSSRAYQAYGKGLDGGMVNLINEWILGNSQPNLVIYLKIDYNAAFERVKTRGQNLTSYEKLGPSFYNKVIKGFEEIFSMRKNVIQIDASQSEDKVKAELLERVPKILADQEIKNDSSS